jgi:hypothetical protein
MSLSRLLFNKWGGQTAVSYRKPPSLFPQKPQGNVKTFVSRKIFGDLSDFFPVFSRRIKAYGTAIAYIRYTEGCDMRLSRDLAENVWYEVNTAVNVGEPLFRLGWAETLFYGVLHDAKGRFGFELRGLVLSEAGLAFYIKPLDGFELPKIMQWIKQTFSVRFNVRTRRKGHVWGDRYWSVILAGEPVGAVAVDWDVVDVEAAKDIPAVAAYSMSWDCPRSAKWEAKTSFSPKTPANTAAPPG